MTSKTLCLAALLIFSGMHTVVSAQTLFTYGNHSVSSDEFIAAYQKNNTDTSGNRIPVSQYLELYKRYKLKVQAALDARLDTTTQQVEELKAFRYQLASNFIKEDRSVDLLVQEAMKRMVKDIRVEHVFVPANAPGAEKTISEISEKLTKGATRPEAAKEHVNGELGWITAFVLPYVLENAVYSAAPGQWSSPLKTEKGYHLLKKIEERPAIGEIKIAQILLAFRPDATSDDKQKLAARADSVYNSLVEGADFARTAALISDDNLTYMNNGELPPFGIGKYDPSFEKQAFALSSNGDISRPFQTSFGYHILKRIARLPVTSDTAAIREKVLTSDRMKEVEKVLVKSIREIVKNDLPAGLENDNDLLEFYRDNLERYNREFAAQFYEFKYGNLLFAIMQDKIWDVAAVDTAALRNYYNSNRDKYYWDNSADAVIFSFLDKPSAVEIQKGIEKNISNWRKWIEESNATIQADSGRYELGQIPVVERTHFQPGLITAPVVNEYDSTMTSAYIIRIYTAKEPKRFEDAKGAVINDYQAYLEEQWIGELEKKYPVRINRKVLRSVERELTKK